MINNTKVIYFYLFFSTFFLLLLSIKGNTGGMIVRFLCRKMLSIRLLMREKRLVIEFA